MFHEFVMLRNLCMYLEKIELKTYFQVLVLVEGREVPLGQNYPTSPSFQLPRDTIIP